MKNKEEFGLNKTPSTAKLEMTEEMAKGYEEFGQMPLDARMEAKTMRMDYIRNSETLGLVPIPSTFKGFLKTSLQALQGKDPEILLDKLGERLAFERGGVRLYEAFITKCEAADPAIDVKVLREFQLQELEHFKLVRDTIQEMGGDPTAQTPCADAIGVANSGIVQVMTDPRTSIPQCVEALLTAEMIDVAAWELLIELLEKKNLKEIAQRFDKAKTQEDIHLATVKEWMRKMTLEGGAVPLSKAG